MKFAEKYHFKATIVSKRSENGHADACEVSQSFGYRKVWREFAGESGLHLVIDKLHDGGLALESEGFSLEQLIEFC